MGTTELYRYQHVIEEIRDTIPRRLEMLDEKHDPDGSRENDRQYADEIKSLVFDVIENSIFWTDKVNELEAFRDHIMEAVDSLDIAIAVWKRSEEDKTSMSRQITRHHH